MANPTLVAAIVLSIVGTVLIAIAIIISFAIARSKTGNTKSALLASGYLTTLLEIVTIITAIIGIVYARGRVGLSPADKTNKDSPASKKLKGFLIAFIVLLTIWLIIYVVVIIVDLVARGKSDLDSTQMGAMTTSIILIAFGFVAVAIGAILILVVSTKAGKQSTKR